MACSVAAISDQNPKARNALKCDSEFFAPMMAVFLCRPDTANQNYFLPPMLPNKSGAAEGIFAAGIFLEPPATFC